MTATTNTDTDQTWLLERLSPHRLAELSQPLTAEQQRLADARIARHGGDPVTAFGASADNPVADQVRALFGVTR
ncbi:hypothetical protein [Actinoplanes sp. URMC 104]|uniref:hypothetical protein n=1 Tax=Actinoplanes sp. URMC 104 TaxID=3423409 RepID=UPI003F194996